VWDELSRRAPVYDRDAIYVPEGSSAVIALDAGGRIVIDERSLVILRRDRDEDTGGTALEVVRGGVSGEAGELPLAIRGGGADLELARGSAVAIRVRQDRSARVTVSRGRARVGEGELASGQRQVVDASGAAQAP